jgi:hypothetical protein
MPSTIDHVVTWDDTENPEWDGLNPIAVWGRPIDYIELDKFGYWQQFDAHQAAISPLWEGTVDEFISEYGVFPNHFCAPGGTFTIQGEVTWTGGAPDRRLL